MENIFLKHPWVLVLILLWNLPWKAAALWRSARRGHLGWFLTLILLNTLAILDILYLVFFSAPKIVRNEEAEQVPTKREPRITKMEKEQLLQKQLLQKEKQRLELEVKQARYAADVKKRLNIL
jgi:methionyl-tRNA synthetase